MIRLIDLGREIDEILDVAGNAGEPTWHPDGRHLAWQTVRKGDVDVYWKDLAAGSVEEPLLVTDDDEWPEAFTADGNGLIVGSSRPDGSYELRLVGLDGSGESRALFEEGEEVALSPGQRWIAYEHKGVFVRPFLRPGPPVRLSRGEADSAAWSPDGATIYYGRGDEIVAVSYREEAGRFVVLDERVLVTFPLLVDFDVAPDGRLLALVAEDPEPNAEIRVVLGWDRAVGGDSR